VTDALDSADERLAANLRALRERKGISQAELARRMSERGHGWQQSTVSRVQAGTQPVRVSEHESLAEILGVSMDRLLWAGPEANEAAYVGQAAEVLRRSWHETALAVQRLRAARSGAEHVITERGDSKYPRVRDACEELGHDLEDCTPETAFDRGADLYEGEIGDDGTDP
jgi:transcriptional regulator with XRE-family HTH domain